MNYGTAWLILIWRDLLSQVRCLTDINSGLSNKVVVTILNARAASPRKLYALRWQLFE